MNISLTNDQIVKRLRGVMIVVIIFNTVNTLLGQPGSYWDHPGTAIRSDGLSVNNAVNHTFDFFLSKGWCAYLITDLLYVFLSFLLVSILPKRAALVAIFAFIFGHYFVGCNWLAVRWHLGLGGLALYGIVLGTVIVQAAFPVNYAISDKIIYRLRWVMTGAILLDCCNTLIGQPAAYWSNTEMVREGNPMSRFFLIEGWWAYLASDLVYCLLAFLLMTFLSRKAGMVCFFAFVFAHFAGASNWFFYEWRMGMESPVIYGVVLSLIIVTLGFPERSKHISLENTPHWLAAFCGIC